jgi:hypothetical protein
MRTNACPIVAALREKIEELASPGGSVADAGDC